MTVIELKAELAFRTMLVYQQYTGSDKENALCDLLADLMHLADEEAYDFDHELNRARGHYGAEIVLALTAHRNPLGAIPAISSKEV